MAQPEIDPSQLGAETRAKIARSGFHAIEGEGEHAAESVPDIFFQWHLPAEKQINFLPESDRGLILRHLMAGQAIQYYGHFIGQEASGRTTFYPPAQDVLVSWLWDNRRVEQSESQI